MPPVEEDEVYLRGDAVRWSKIVDKVNAVCQLSLPDCSRFGSGFLAKCKIGTEKRTFLLTNNHVVESRVIAETIVATFNFDGKGDPMSISLCPDIFYKCSSTNDYDYTMVGVEERVIQALKEKHQITPVNLRPVESTLIDSLDILSIPQHPGGRQKRFSYGKVCNIEAHFIQYDADTAPGSSGAPVLFPHNGDCRVLALHKGSTSCNGVLVNKGIFINTILSDANDEPVQPLAYRSLTQRATRPLQSNPGFTEKELTRIGQRIPEHWGEVGLATGKMKSYEISVLRIDPRFPSPDTKAIEMLLGYKRRRGSREDLIEALMQFGYVDLARRVENQFFKAHAIEQDT